VSKKYKTSSRNSGTVHAYTEYQMNRFHSPVLRIPKERADLKNYTQKPTDKSLLVQLSNGNDDNRPQHTKYQFKTIINVTTKTAYALAK
jgi:hypothetical protein